MVRGSILCTAPFVPRGKETSKDWFEAMLGTFSGSAGTRPKLFLFSCRPKPLMGCMALFDRVISIMTWSPFREKVPEISRPLPFDASSQTLLGGM